MLNSLTVLGPSSPAGTRAGLVDRDTGPTCWASQGLSLSQYRQRPEPTLPRGHGPVVGYSLNSPTTPAPARRATGPGWLPAGHGRYHGSRIPAGTWYPNREQGERPRHLRRRNEPPQIARSVTRPLRPGAPRGPRSRPGAA